MRDWVILNTTDGRVMLRRGDIRRVSAPTGGTLAVETNDCIVYDVTDDLDTVIRSMGFEPEGETE